MQILPLLLVVLPLFPAAAAPTAERTLPRGVTVEQLRGRLGGSLRPPRDGETGDAVLDGASVAGCPASARLFVGGDGVRKVFFAAASCADLETRLERRYGTPASARRAPGDVELEWARNGERVRFVHVHVSDPHFDWDRQFVTFEREMPSAGR